MDEQKNSVMNPRDEVEEVAQVISFLGRVIGAVALDDYERVGAQVVAESQLNCTTSTGSQFSLTRKA